MSLEETLLKKYEQLLREHTRLKRKTEEVLRLDLTQIKEHELLPDSLYHRSRMN